MSVSGEPMNPAPVQESGVMAWMNNHRRAGGALAAAALLASGFGIAAARGDGESSAQGGDAAASAEPFEMCDVEFFAPESSDAMRYNQDAFLPHSEAIESAEDVKSYVAELFGEEGPFGKDTDRVSLAAVWALVGEPSHDGAVVNVDYDYMTAFNNALARYGTEAAETDCNILRETLSQTAALNLEWAQAGETLIQAIPVRDENNVAQGMDFIEVVTTDKIGGIELKLRSTVRGIDGFMEVLITEDGRMFIRGVAASQLQNIENETPAPVTPAPEEGAVEAPVAPVAGGTVETSGTPREDEREDAPAGRRPGTHGAAGQTPAEGTSGRTPAEGTAGSCAGCGASTGTETGGTCAGCGSGAGSGESAGNGNGGEGAGDGGNGNGGNGGGNGGEKPRETTTTTTAPRPTTTTTVAPTTTTTAPRPTTTTTIKDSQPACNPANPNCIPVSDTGN